MELYLLMVMVVLYVITMVILDKRQRSKIWLFAFIAAFAVTAMALSFWRFTNREVMMNVVAVSWYYILYLSISLLIVLGVINLWIFKRQLWDVLTEDSDDESEP